MSLNWTTYNTTLANLMGDPLLINDANFQQIIPSTIDDAELRLYRELQLLSTVVTDSSNVTTPNLRSISWGNQWFVVDSINVISPAGTTNPDLGTRNPLLPATKEMCDFLYPSVTGATIPQYLGRVTQSTAVLAPWPDQAYTLEITGTQRPTPLSVSNTTTILSTYFPDLLTSASMIYLSGYAQNFSAMGDNPQQAVNWNTHFQDQLKSAATEEAMKKFEAEGWGSKQPSPIATPART
jgi:hypothetical protein